MPVPKEVALKLSKIAVETLEKLMHEEPNLVEAAKTLGRALEEAYLMGKNNAHPS